MSALDPTTPFLAGLLLHLFFEIVQHRQADVRLIEDQDARRIPGPIDVTTCSRNCATVEQSNRVWQA